MEQHQQHDTNGVTNNFLVYVRVRPLTWSESMYKSFPKTFYGSPSDINDKLMDTYIEKDEDGATIINDILHIENNHVITVMNPDKISYERREKTYEFNEVFHPQVPNSYVFDVSLRPHLDNFLEGYNTTFFAFGITGSGKTHTIFGDLNENKETMNTPGMCFLACEYLFDEMKKSPEKYENCRVKFSFIEIYNENVRDLLSDGEKNFVIMDDPQKGTFVQDLREYEVDELEDVHRPSITFDYIPFVVEIIDFNGK